MFELLALVSTFVVFFIGWTCRYFVRKMRAMLCAGIGAPDRYRDDLNRYAVGEARRFLEARGWTLDSASTHDLYDLVGARKKRRIFVFARGTWGHWDDSNVFPGGPGEAIAKEHPNDSIRFILHYVSMKPGEDGPLLSGGKPKIFWPEKENREFTGNDLLISGLLFLPMYILFLRLFYGTLF
ncbi:MAG: hypothetical protein QF645_10680 [Planctomycetota bacterium]|jgi:hypothetical protein|nr:hypothetical protein [Planctomycetota bacterium]